MKDTYKIIEINKNEFHILEYQGGRMTDNPFVIAICSGPVPANDVFTALVTKQYLENEREAITNMKKNLCANFEEGLTNLEIVLKKYHHVKVN